MKKVKSENLMRVGKLEQSFVFGGGATFKDLFQELGSRVSLSLSYCVSCCHSSLEIPFLPAQDISVQSKLRLMAIYAATHPDKFTPEKRDIYMKVLSSRVPCKARIAFTTSPACWLCVRLRSWRRMRCWQ